MLKTIHYGSHTFKPWCPGTGYVNVEAKSLKSYRSREPRSIWQSLQSKTEDLGEYDLYICKHCFLYSSKPEDIRKHEKLCRYRDGPPGQLLFEDSKYKILEVQIAPESGLNNSTSASTNENEQNEEYRYYFSKTPEGLEFNSLKLYLQSLSLFGSLFLDTKSICFCVDAFIFYMAVDKSTNMVAGFFSKERHSWHEYNLACIVIFPPWQQHGLGQRLISFSYLLSRQAGKSGSPEKPLSKHGKIAYEKYWKRKISERVSAAHSEKSASKAKLSLNQLSKETGIDPMDLFNALKSAKTVNNGVIHLEKLLAAPTWSNTNGNGNNVGNSYHEDEKK